VAIFDERGEIIDKTQHVRYCCEPKIVLDFIKRYKGFENIERKFVLIETLKDAMPILKIKAREGIINKLIKNKFLKNEKEPTPPFFL
jgi:hypothetical protein